MPPNIFKVLSLNAEGMSSAKAEILSSSKADVICLQETHKDNVPPKIPGMHLIIHHPSPVYGSAIYAKDKSVILNSSDFSEGGIEIIQVDTTHFKITSVYKPPAIPFQWPQTLQISDKSHLIIGDFNSHSTTWGYNQTNNDGEAVEEWAASNDLTIMYDAKDHATFQSSRWRRGYNPDLAFITSRYYTSFGKSIGNPIPRTQHNPVIITTKPVIRPQPSNLKPRFNFRKANWDGFTNDLDESIPLIPPLPEQYETFQALIQKTARANIPRGCRKNYIPGLDQLTKEQYKEYVQAFNEDPFAESTLELGETLLASISKDQNERWKEIITNIDMTHNSKKAWSTIKKLNSEKEAPPRVAAVTPNQVAHQLLLNGKPQHKIRGQVKKTKEEMSRVIQNSTQEAQPFTTADLNAAITRLKLGKASGEDGITNEMVLHFGEKAKLWLLSLYNNCASSLKTPKIWRRARVVALLKPGKEPTSPKSYRPISLLCVLYKLYERLILMRMQDTVEEHLSPDQAGFRPGRSCCSQVLNLTQYIEDGYECKQITGTVLVDLTAAYDTVNHRSLLLKVAQLVRNATLVHMIESLLVNRRFYVEMEGRKSKWHTQKNGLPQGSVLAPILFNIYNNDQPQYHNIRRYIYADDLCLATQATSFSEIERRLSSALNTLSAYYKKWHLNANPSKTQVCAFHLNNHLAKRELRVKWGHKELEHHPYPVYQGVTLDRTLSFKEHITKLRAKLSTRNNLLSKLANSSWGADPKTLRNTALALCYSTAEYCAPVWARSCHAHKINPELNRACRTITGLLKSTPLPALYRLSGIPPPNIRRDVTTKLERHKQMLDPRHSLHGHQEMRRRLKSRKCFLTVEPVELSQADNYMLECWCNSEQQQLNEALPDPAKSLPSGMDLSRKCWVALNRARSKTGKTKDNLHKWGITTNPDCMCGVVQTMEHLLRDCPMGPHCSDQDLKDANENAIKWIQFYCDKI
ncbi:hypothetical protein Pmani_016968 [Petrolisthes manimaculis]|uniref:Reverse transcriptase domain-containing protein n=2 Tax=Petrolisthes manimaculis TaxID=1843537 RepID=A0AAE1PMR8_9EUCA|nr:hypothetical protein Pmani_017215 [Petrolisthes manimaculis]KAK4311534.1 hypothetical protein Pmani_016968 [Petrolisthes manimaculis]